MKLTEGYTVDTQVQNWFLYYLVDGFYPEWTVFLRPINSPHTVWDKAMTKVRESRRKDLKRLFGVLQGCLLIFERNFMNGISETKQRL